MPQRKKSNTKKVGDLGEELAVGILKRSGYKIIARNYRTNFGEIDIVAVKNDILVFVEVKTRWSKKYGKPEEAVNSRKLERIKKAGQLYKIQNKNLPDKLRIDVVAIDLTDRRNPKSKIINVI